MTEPLAFPPDLDLTATEIRIATMLMLRERVAGEVLRDALRGSRDRKPEIAAVRAHISQLRKKLAKRDLRIETIWGFGWKMEAADREELRRLTSR